MTTIEENNENPNICRSNDHPIKIWTTEIITSTKLRKLRMCQDQWVWELQAACGCMEIIGEDNRIIDDIQRRESRRIRGSDWWYSLKTTHSVSIIAREFRKTPLKEYNPREFGIPCAFLNMHYEPTKVAMKKKKIFVCECDRRWLRKAYVNIEG